MPAGIRLGLLRPPASGGARARVVLAGALLLLAVVWPLGGFWAFSVTRWLVFATAGLAVVVLTGWVGQVSLMPATFVGLGAFGVGRLVVAQETPILLSAPLAMGLAAATAVAVGLVGLRIRGLYFAVVTLVFAGVFDDFFFRQAWFTTSSNTVRIPRPEVVRGDFAYLVAVVAVIGALLWFLWNIESTRTARAAFGVRDNPTAATALGVNVTRYRLFAFALHGAIAGLAGVLFGLLLGTVSAGGARPFFGLETSLAITFFTVVGGLRSLWGPVVGGLLYYIAIDETLRALGVPSEDVDGIRLLLFGLLVVVVLMASPGGVVGLLARARARFAGPRDAWRRDVTVAATAPPVVEPGPDGDGAGERQRLPARPPARRRGVPEVPALEVVEVSVRFGGVAAVDSVSLEVAQGEIVGLIGPNGAGKTTLMDAVSGFVPGAGGMVHLGGRDVSGLLPYERARAGLGRSFQAVRLFPTLTVRDNLKMAGHRAMEASFVAGGMSLPVSRREEARLAEHLDEALEVVDLSDYLDKPARELSFGTLRALELACLLIVRPSVLLLDEPASGLAQKETEALGPLLRRVRESIDASVLIIEHDMPLVMSLADRVYALDLGRVMASGTPAEVRSDRKVLESYLGTGRYTSRRPVGGTAKRTGSRARPAKGAGRRGVRIARSS